MRARCNQSIPRHDPGSFHGSDAKDEIRLTRLGVVEETAEYRRDGRLRFGLGQFQLDQAVEDAQVDARADRHRLGDA